MLKEISIAQVQLNPFTAIGKEWMLITAGDEKGCNMMTASWGGMGVLWRKNVAMMVIRPQRHTLSFVDNQDYYALCFFDEKYREALNFCGKYSGRDYDKAKETGLTTVFDAEAPYFAEAKLVIICKKLYKHQFDPACFIDNSIDANCYPDKDYHECFVGEVVKVLAE